MHNNDSNNNDNKSRNSLLYNDPIWTLDDPLFFDLDTTDFIFAHYSLYLLSHRPKECPFLYFQELQLQESSLELFSPSFLGLLRVISVSVLLN